MFGLALARFEDEQMSSKTNCDGVFLTPSRFDDEAECLKTLTLVHFSHFSPACHSLF